MRRRDPRRLLERDRRALARVTIVEVPQSGYSENGALGSRQVAEVTVPRAELEKIWRPEYLERLARTYWSFLSRFSLGLIRVLYSEDSRDVVFLRRPFVLLGSTSPSTSSTPTAAPSPGRSTAACWWRGAGAGAASCG